MYWAPVCRAPYIYRGAIYIYISICIYIYIWRSYILLTTAFNLNPVVLQRPSLCLSKWRASTSSSRRLTTFCIHHPGLPPPRTRSGERLFIICYTVWKLCWGSTGPGRCPFVLLAKLYIECIQNHVWAPPGAADMNIFLKHMFLTEITRGVMTTVEQSVENYIERLS